MERRRGYVPARQMADGGVTLWLAHHDLHPAEGTAQRRGDVPDGQSPAARVAAPHHLAAPFVWVEQAHSHLKIFQPAALDERLAARCRSDARCHDGLRPAHLDEIGRASWRGREEMSV